MQRHVFTGVVLRVTHAGSGAHNLELTRRDLLFVTHAVLVLNGTRQDIGQNFHIFMGMRTKPLTAVDNIFVNHPQCREAHKVGVVVIGKRKGVVAVQPAMISMTAILCFA